MVLSATWTDTVEKCKRTIDGCDVSRVVLIDLGARVLQSPAARGVVFPF